ncbi:MAG: hypothetical protein M3M96_08930 [Candidatus Eremiobacteraeota bacterium]|nr:hypothetical protein [Candidatus Eremiobacteraeota bacterium]
MNTGIPQSAAISAVAVLGAIVHVVLGIRVGRCDTTSALARFVVAFVALGVAVLVFVPIISPVVGYGMLCLALVSVYLFDLLRDEHTRRRRVASLTPRPAAEAVPSVWVAIAVASVLLLAPYVVLGEQRAAALMVGVCAFVMAGIAWRIASAPVQLEGDDIQTERIRIRASRSRKAGLTAVLAIGSIFVFISFVNGDLPAVLPLQRIVLLVSFVTWAGLWAWVTLYWRYLDRLSCSAP